ncbi:hypothetical protein [Paenibacillus sp. LjRoot56]|uniref:hypothetical protein n=1 Tax=Paenibacillus sp. LjRoot56 TaxID=3342333 RepID=UPI003ECF7BE8
MKFKLVVFLCVIVMALVACGKQETPEPVVGTKVSTAVIKDMLFQSGHITLNPYDGSDWTLNGQSPETYYLSCGPTEDCVQTKEHISIYTFKSNEERDKGFADFKKQKDQYNMIVPIVWQNKNTILLYWHSSPFGQKTAYEDRISEGLKGWNMQFPNK